MRTHSIIFALCCTAIAATYSGLRAADMPPGAPPAVTCRGWAIGDGKSGEVLWGNNADVPMRIASNAKMMTAWVVFELAKIDPKVWDELVTFSELADKTTGTTAGVKAGEKVSVRETLYGLLLPSGNDAAVALAEHFNARLAPPTADLPAATTTDSQWNFIAEMNRTAKKLGLDKTTYRAAWADGKGTDPTSSPRDLIKLAHCEMSDPRFREYVSTVQHEADVMTPDGQKRHVVWKNTNKFLKEPGYDGVKTGYTVSAGYCLVIHATKDGDGLYAVVLGSSTDQSRYDDVRALLNWAWPQRAGK